MTTHFFDSWVAKTFLFPSYRAITLFGLSFYKDKKENVSERTINHESIHQRQQIECIGLGIAVSAMLFGLFGLTWLLIIPPLTFFYVWYIIELLIGYLFNMFNNTKTYYTLAFEMEAYDNDENFNYLLDRKDLKWMSYLGTTKFDKNLTK